MTIVLAVVLAYPLWERLFVGVTLAAGVAYFVTPIAIVTARRLSFYDLPAGYKGHSAPTPYLGGAAVMTAFVVAMVVGAWQPSRTLPLLGGVVLLWLIGTLDDRRNVSPAVRVSAEVALAVGLTLVGEGWHLKAGEGLDALVNGIWVVGVINAFNLFDNMDGAASTMALVVAAGACALGLLNDNPWAVVASAALCGACLGFLPHNLSRPARIFLGDGGSMPLGFAIAVLVASAARGAGPALLSLTTGLLLIGLPALDTTLVIVSRRRRGISILTGGQDHLTHRTRVRVRTARRVALVLGATQALISALVIAATRSGATTIGYLLIVFVVLAGVTILAFERAVEPASSAGSIPERAELASSAPWFTGMPPVALVVIGLGAGLSSFFASYYDSGVWIPTGFALVIAAAVGFAIRPPRVTLPMLLMALGTAGLGLISLLSSMWASGVEAATTDANRWLTYAALLLLIFLLVRRGRDSGLLLTAVGVGIAVAAGSVVVRLLGNAPADLFIGGRLNSPLGYVNGEACVFAMGMWFALALAERREFWLAGVGSAGAVIFGSLTLLSQSRGAAIASGAAVLVAMAVFPGRRRRILALAAVLIGVIVAASPVLDVYRSSHGATVPTAAAHDAGWAMLGAAAFTGLVWASLVAFGGSLYDRSPTRQAALQRLATGLAVAIVLIPVAGGLAKSATIERTISSQWHAFVHISEQASSPAASSGATRLLTGSGNRYDYWRIAWSVFKAHPLVGVGAGNYTASYYRSRRTQEAIENPHSLELQTLSELGVVGALILVLLLAGVAIGARRLRHRARESSQARTVLVAAGGTFVVWLIDTSGDWMHLLPGVTAVAIVAMGIFAIEVVPAAEPTRVPARRKRRAAPLSAPFRGPGALLAGAAVALVLTVAGGNLLRQGLSQRYLHDAQGELSTRPAAAVSDAVKALRLDAGNLDAYYVKAAGEARFDNASAAQTTLLAAAHEDSQNFVTWVLLGDLDVRRHNYRAAAAFYGQAHVLDPNDPAIAALAAHPAHALASP